MDKSKRDRVFLSYAKEDLDVVRRVFHGLTKRQLDVWFYEEHARPGEWRDQILKAIARSRFFVICISKAALRKTGDERSGFQDDELNRAYDIAKNQPNAKFSIVPVRLEDCDRGDFRLSSFHQYDLFNDFDSELDKLAINLNGISQSDAATRDERTENEKVIDHLWNTAGTFYYAGDYDKAIAIWDSILVMLPDQAEAWLNKGSALGLLGRHEEAMAVYDKALAINPDLAMAWQNRGVALRDLGHDDEAVAAYDKAIAINPDNDAALLLKGVALGSMGRTQEALRALDKAIEINPDLAMAWYCRGLALRDSGHHDEAIAAYDKAIAINPNNDVAWRNKGDAFERSGHPEKAIAAYDKAIAITLCVNITETPSPR